MLQNRQDHGALRDWVKRLRTRNIPVFSQTVQDIARLTASDRSSALDLTHVILRDPALTARVLRAANSFYHNPNRRPIQNISRAVVMLGFDTLRRIALAVAVFEEVLRRGPHRERIAQELARSFHAAVQAQALALRFAERDSEDIFIAALLHGVGALAFWNSGEAATDDLDTALRRGGASRSRAEEEVLGFQLRELSLRLSKTWRLSRLLVATLDGEAMDPRTPYIEYGRRIAEAAELGWGGEEIEQLLDQLAAAFGPAPFELRVLLSDSARKAIDLASSCDAEQIARLIPPPGA